MNKKNITLSDYITKSVFISIRADYFIKSNKIITKNMDK